MWGVACSWGIAATGVHDVVRGSHGGWVGGKVIGQHSCGGQQGGPRHWCDACDVSTTGGSGGT